MHQRIAFLCWLIGRIKTWSYLARIRVAGKKLKQPIKDFLKRFRDKRRQKFGMRIHAALMNFAKMDKVVVAGRVIMMKIVKI